MKTFLTTLAVIVLLASPLHAAPRASFGAGPHALAIGARQHVDHSVFEQLPYDDGDIAYLLAYEYHEPASLLQLAVEYAPDVNGTNAVDYVITPQLNIIFKSGVWRAGAGVMGSYIVDDATGDGDWTDAYGQFILGLGMPLGAATIGVDAYYVFEDFGAISDFEGRDIEYAAWLSYRF